MITLADPGCTVARFPKGDLGTFSCFSEICLSSNFQVLASEAWVFSGRSRGGSRVPRPDFLPLLTASAQHLGESTDGRVLAPRSHGTRAVLSLNMEPDGGFLEGDLPSTGNKWIWTVFLVMLEKANPKKGREGDGGFLEDHLPLTETSGGKHVSRLQGS